MTVVITGASGQDGYYLSRLLEKEGCKVVGVSRSENFDHTDITRFDEVSRLVDKHKPGFIFHLAAESTTNHEALFTNQGTIVTGTLHILEAVKLYSPATKVFVTGSGLQFMNTGRPIKETDPFEARDAYSLCRIQSVYAARYYRSAGVKVYVGYLFNHDSPLRTEKHMTRKIAETVKRIGRGSTKKLVIGDMEAVKEYGFAGDIARGIWTLVNQDIILEANISTGKGYSITDWLEQCFAVINKNWQDHIAMDKEFVPEYRQLVSDPSLIFSLGWEPEVSFEELAKLMMK